jgi:O-antigen/teichoic acid export membrane protein
LRFGVSVAVGGSLFYLYSKADRFFGGRALASTALGYYCFALQLSQLPTEKIVVLINQVSFSAFSQLQDEAAKFKKFYLNITKMTATLVIPIFVGGFLMGGDVVRVILNEKWFPMIPLFEYLCIAQIMTAMNAVNNFVHTAQGRPNWSLYFNAAMALFFPVSFYFAVQHGLKAILIPWFTTYLFMCTAWMLVTLKKIGISVGVYGRNLVNPLAATLMMSAIVMICKYAFNPVRFHEPPVFAVIAEVLFGTFVYAFYLWRFDRGLFEGVRRLIRT